MVHFMFMLAEQPQSHHPVSSHHLGHGASRTFALRKFALLMLSVMVCITVKWLIH